MSSDSTATLADRTTRAADRARRHALAYPGSTSRDALPWAVVEAFDADTCNTCAWPSPTGRVGGNKVAGLPGPPPTPSLPAVLQAIIGRLLASLIPPARCPHCQRRFKLPSDLKVPR